MRSTRHAAPAAATPRPSTPRCWPSAGPTSRGCFEDNCRPGIEVHPAVRPFYDAFILLSAWASPNDPSPCYVQWLVGDATTVDESTRQRYMQRLVVGASGARWRAHAGTGGRLSEE